MPASAFQTATSTSQSPTPAPAVLPTRQPDASNAELQEAMAAATYEGVVAKYVEGPIRKLLLTETTAGRLQLHAAGLFDGPLDSLAERIKGEDPSVQAAMVDAWADQLVQRLAKEVPGLLGHADFAETSAGLKGVIDRASQEQVLLAGLLAAGAAVAANAKVPEPSIARSWGGVSGHLSADLGQWRDLAFRSLTARLGGVVGSAVVHGSVTVDRDRNVTGSGGVVLDKQDLRAEVNASFDATGTLTTGALATTGRGLQSVLRGMNNSALPTGVTYDRGADALVFANARDRLWNATDLASNDPVRPTSDVARLKVDRSDPRAGPPSTTVGLGYYGSRANAQLGLEAVGHIESGAARGHGFLDLDLGNHRVAGVDASYHHEAGRNRWELGAYAGSHNPAQGESLVGIARHTHDEQKGGTTFLGYIAERRLGSDVYGRLDQRVAIGPDGRMLDTQVLAAKKLQEDLALIGGVRHTWDFHDKHVVMPQVGVQIGGIPLIMSYDPKREAVHFTITFPLGTSAKRATWR